MNALLAGLLVAASFLSGIAVPLGPLSVRPEQIAGPLVLLVVLLRPAYRAPRAVLFVLLWLATGVAGALGEAETSRALVHALRLFATALPVVLLPMLVRGPSAGRAWDGYLLFGTIASLAGLAALASHRIFGTSLGIVDSPRLGYVAAQGTILEPNILGALAAAVAVPLVLRALDAALPPGRRLLAGALATINVLALLASVTRAAWLTFPVVLLLALVLDASLAPRERQLRTLRLAAAGCLGAGLVLSLALAVDASAARGARTGLVAKALSLTRSTTLEDDPNVRIRLGTYRHALAIFRDAPAIGKGHGAMERGPGMENREMAWAGNLEIHLLADTGLLGTAAFFAFVGFALVVTARRTAEGGREARRRALERLAVLATLILAAQATETSWLAAFWVPFGLALAAASAETAVPRPASKPLRLPRRILFAHPSDELYGSDRVLLGLVSRLPRERVAPVVLLSNDVLYEGRLSRRLEAQGVPVERLRIGVLRRNVLTSPLRFARFLRDSAVSTVAIARLVRKENIDLVHVNTVAVFPAALGARLAGRPVVWHVHEILPDRAGRLVMGALVRLLASRIAVVSSAAGDALGGAESVIVHNGLALPEAAAISPSGPPTVLYAGRLTRWKGPDVLLHAFARVAPEFPAAKLVFSGGEFDGGAAMREELLDTARSLGIAERVTILPFTEDPSALLAQATVVVGPSVRPEPFGLVLLEAMALGRPVIATDHGGPRELIVNGESGLLVSPGDVAALAGALRSVLGDRELALRLGRAARDRAAHLFTEERMVERFLALYEDTPGNGS